VLRDVISVVAKFMVSAMASALHKKFSVRAEFMVTAVKEGGAQGVLLFARLLASSPVTEWDPTARSSAKLLATK
jgi:hypothetical protein